MVITKKEERRTVRYRWYQITRLLNNYILHSVFTAPKRSFGQGIVFTPVCHSVHGGRGVGVSAPLHAGIHTLLADPPRQTPTHPRQTPPGYYGIWSTSGWYASYLNAYLLLPPTNEVCRGYVFTHVCHSVHRGSAWSWGVPGRGIFENSHMAIISTWDNEHEMDIYIYI